jgi:hypothetical protein
MGPESAARHWPRAGGAPVLTAFLDMIAKLSVAARLASSPWTKRSASSGAVASRARSRCRGRAPVVEEQRSRRALLFVRSEN